MITKLKTLKDESLKEQSFLQRMAAPVKYVLSYFKGLIGGGRETIQQTCSTPNKFIISKKKKFGSLYDASTDNTIKIINLRGEDSNFNKNSSINSCDEWRQPENSNKIGFSEDLRNINLINNRVTYPLPCRDLNEKELKIIDSKQIKIRENLKIGKCFSESNEKMKKFEDVLSTIKYTVENKTNYLSSEINLSQKIIEEENLRKVQRFDGSLKAFNVINILTTKFDPGKVINDSSLHIKGNFKNSKISNLPSQNTADNLSIYSNTTNKSNITFVKTEEVSSNQNKKLFNINNKKRNYDEHVKTCNLGEEEKLSEIAARTKCGDCLKMKYEINQMKIKLRDSIMDKRNEEKKKKQNSKFTSGDETPSTINQNNMTNLLMSGSISFSQSRESVNNSFTSDKGYYKPFKIENNNIVNSEQSNNNQFFFKNNQIAIPEDHENETLTESKTKPNITPQFRSHNNNMINFDKSEVDAKVNEEKIEKKIVNLIDNSEDKKHYNFFNFKNPKNDAKILFETNKKDNFKVNIMNIQFIQSLSTAEKNKDEEIDGNKIFENTKDMVKDDSSSLNNLENTNKNEEKEKYNLDNDFFDTNQRKNSDPKNEEPIKSVKKDLNKTYQFLNQPTADISCNLEENPRFHLQVNDATKIKRIENATEDESINSKRIDKLGAEQIIQIKDIQEKKEENSMISKFNFPTKEINTSNATTSNSLIVRNPSNEQNIQCDKNIPNIITDCPSSDIKLFTERPKGTFINNINIPCSNKESNTSQMVQESNNITNKEKIDNIISKEIHLNNSDASNDLNHNNKLTNLLTDIKSNPFLQNGFIEKTISLMNNSSSTLTNIIKPINSISNLIIPNSQNNVFNNHSAINNFQSVSPSSSTYSDMTFGNKNIHDSSTNHIATCALNTNSFLGNNITFNHSNNINMINNIKPNLYTVCEDDGKMSVEKNNPLITTNTNNSNINLNFLNNNKDPFNRDMNTNHSKIQLKSFTSNLSSNVFKSNSNLNPVYNSQIKSENFSHNNNNNNIVATNNTNSHQNVMNNNISNEQVFGNTSNPFNRNNLLTQNDNGKNNSFVPNSNVFNSNPFLVNKSNTINTTSSGGGLGLFDEHGPPQRRLGSYRR